ncbi:class I SAM-dependent methyltransferase [Streptomyces sp. NPDC014735]|uniref:class I SAM-dependent methyltransferase n=1 Tax=unclassified Streptomyces TaxID=2593676 RepID=UPI00093A6F73|nr:class I SAM-dependent methyltransferase [Streptomyces sp. CB01580]
MPGTKPDLKSLRATKYTSSTRTTGSLERLRRLGYNAGLQALDLWDTLRGRDHPLLPPRRHRRFIGNGDFLEVGRQITAYMRDELGVGPGHDVLDAGCGAGRIAVPLTDVLTEGSYLGFDIVPHAVEWCSRTITPRHPNFRFAHVDIRQEIYNPQGTLSAADLRFPADDAAFDTAALVGLISHLRPAELENYLAESARVLRPGGQCFATAYLVDDTVAANIARGTTAFEFTHDHGDYYVHSEEEPTYAIAYRLEHILSVAARHGLRMRRDPRPGTWGVSTRRPASMDLLVLERA